MRLLPLRLIFSDAMIHFLQEKAAGTGSPVWD
jgi:hypothetical protein